MVNSPSQPSRSSVIRPIPDGPEFVVTDEFLGYLGEYVAYRPRQMEYLQAIAWQIAHGDPRANTIGPEEARTRAYDSQGWPAWPALRIWLWFESEDKILFCDVEEA
jgi:hypothetical protein